MTPVFMLTLLVILGAFAGIAFLAQAYMAMLVFVAAFVGVLIAIIHSIMDAGRQDKP